jgi:hypothetical protein
MLSSLFCQSNNDKKCFIAETSALEQLHLGSKLIAPFTFMTKVQNSLARHTFLKVIILSQVALFCLLYNAF